MIKNLFKIDAAILEIPGIDNKKLAEEVLVLPKRRSDDPTCTRYEDIYLKVHKGSESEKLINYMTQYGEDHNMMMVDYWSQIHHHLESTDLHVHGHIGLVDFSWVYYAKVPEKAGKLVFVLNDTDERTPISTIEPKEGMLIIFPGYLKHKVTKNMDKESRVSISGNFRLIE